MKVEDGQTITRGTMLCEWDPHSVPVLSEGLEQVGAPQRQKLARLKGMHRGVARGVGQEGRLPE